MNVQALRRVAQNNGKALATKSTNEATATEQLSKWGTTGNGAVKRR